MEIGCVALLTIAHKSHRYGFDGCEAMTTTTTTMATTTTQNSNIKNRISRNVAFPSYRRSLSIVFSIVECLMCLWCAFVVVELTVSMFFSFWLECTSSCILASPKWLMHSILVLVLLSLLSYANEFKHFVSVWNPIVCMYIWREKENIAFVSFNFRMEMNFNLIKCILQINVLFVYMKWHAFFSFTRLLPAPDDMNLFVWNCGCNGAWRLRN